MVLSTSLFSPSSHLLFLFSPSSSHCSPRWRDNVLLSNSHSTGQVSPTWSVTRINKDGVIQIGKASVCSVSLEWWLVWDGINERKRAGKSNGRVRTRRVWCYCSWSSQSQVSHLSIPWRASFLSEMVLRGVWVMSLLFSFDTLDHSPSNAFSPLMTSESPAIPITLRALLHSKWPEDRSRIQWRYGRFSCAEKVISLSSDGKTGISESME